MKLRGTIDIYDLATGYLVFSNQKRTRVTPSHIDTERDYLIVRHLAPDQIARCRIIPMPLTEFFGWYYSGLSYFEAFSDMPTRDFNFILHANPNGATSDESA